MLYRKDRQPELVQSSAATAAASIASDEPSESGGGGSAVQARSSKDFSRLIGDMWRDEPEHVKDEYRRRAELAREEHKRKFPDYKYSPHAKKRFADETAESRRKRRAMERAAATCNVVFNATSGIADSCSRIEVKRLRTNAATASIDTNSVDLQGLEPDNSGIHVLTFHPVDFDSDNDDDDDDEADQEGLRVSSLSSSRPNHTNLLRRPPTPTPEARQFPGKPESELEAVRFLHAVGSQPQAGTPFVDDFGMWNTADVRASESIMAIFGDAVKDDMSGQDAAATGTVHFKQSHEHYQHHYRHQYHLQNHLMVDPRLLALQQTAPATRPEASGTAAATQLYVSPPTSCAPTPRYGALPDPQLKMLPERLALLLTPPTTGLPLTTALARRPAAAASAASFDLAGLDLAGLDDVVRLQLQQQLQHRQQQREQKQRLHLSEHMKPQDDLDQKAELEHEHKGMAAAPLFPPPASAWMEILSGPIDMPSALRPTCDVSSILHDMGLQVAAADGDPQQQQQLPHEYAGHHQAVALNTLNTPPHHCSSEHGGRPQAALPSRLHISASSPVPPAEAASPGGGLTLKDGMLSPSFFAELWGDGNGAGDTASIHEHRLEDSGLANATCHETGVCG
ncbi:hypothetical protein HK405_007845 [Cladochytrium tenue]|nr:hypothetical protein HK405_007845 [Cladochytrium tenue]